jgi:hypothetical protein
VTSAAGTLQRAALRQLGGVLTAVLRLARREPLLLALLGFGAVLFVYRYAVDLQRPGQLFPDGYWGFNDQGFYLREARHLSNLETIPAPDFAYGPGYPFLAAPFAAIGAQGWPFRDPFLPADAAIWLLTLATIFLVGRRLSGDWVGLAAGLGLALATPLLTFMTIPWNTTAVVAAVDAVLLVSLARRLRWWHGAWLGVAVAFAYSSRYTDAIWVAIAAITVLVARRAIRLRSVALWSTAAGAVVGVLPTLLLQRAAFGSLFTTPYQYLGNVGWAQFDIGNIPSHAEQVFLSPWFFGSGPGADSPALLALMFAVVLTPVGYAIVLVRSRGARRVLVLGLGLASLLGTLFYCAFYFTTAYGLQFGALHFFKAWWPLWTLSAVAAVSEVGRWLLQKRTAPA